MINDSVALVIEGFWTKGSRHMERLWSYLSKEIRKAFTKEVFMLYFEIKDKI